MNPEPVTALSIILPVINERKNLETLIPELVKACNEVDVACEIIVVDDGSTD